MQNKQNKFAEKKFYEKLFERASLVDSSDGHCITYGYEEIYSSTVDKVKPGSIIDVGCGTGKHSINLAKKGFKVFSVELTENGIVAAKKTATEMGVNIFLVRGDVECMPFKNNAFDYSFCGLIIHHFVNPDKMLDEVTRVTRKSLFAYEPNALEPITMFKFNIINPVFGISRMTKNQRALNPVHLKRKLKDRGFSSFLIGFIDIHANFGGIIGKLTKIYYTGIAKLLSLKYRANKFTLFCDK